MPTYAYACTACEHRFEVQQSFSDDALIECPECQGRLRKLFNSVGIVFKGSGFYRTDSRNGSGAPGSGEKAGEKSGEKAAEKAAEKATEKAASTSSSDSGGSSGSNGSSSSTASASASTSSGSTSSTSSAGSAA